MDLSRNRHSHSISLRVEEVGNPLGEILRAIEHRRLAQQISSPLVFLKLTLKRSDRFGLLEIAGVLRQVLEQSYPFFHGANGSPDELLDGIG